MQGVPAANGSWYKWDGPDVLFGGGAENFVAGPGNGNKSSIDAFRAKGYSFATNATSLARLPNDQRALGLFTQGNLSTWLDQKIYTDALRLAADPLTGERGTSNVLDQPTLANMTIKAIDSASLAPSSGSRSSSEAAIFADRQRLRDDVRGCVDRQGDGTSVEQRQC